MRYNPEKHHRKSIRIPDYDYTQEGWYYVTICVNKHKCLLGEVVEDKMILNQFGIIADEKWQWLENQYNYIKLDKWQIMPNHMHGIIGFIGSCSGSRTAPTKYKPLGRIIGAFKTVSTKTINKIKHSPGERFWQRDFWEHIIRNEQELNRIRSYIIRNPEKWHHNVNFWIPARAPFHGTWPG